MRYVIIFILLIGCSTKKSGSKIFLTPENAVVLDIEKFQTINAFEQAYCAHFDSSANKKLYLPFDFEQNQIVANSKYSIPIMGPIMRCSPALIRSDIVIYLDSAGHMTNIFEEPLSLNEIDSIFRINTFNFGLDPTLSDEPRKALFSISLEEGLKLQHTNKILGTIANTYESIITHLSDKMSISNAIDSIPLNIILMVYVEPPPRPTQDELDSIREEIEGVIELDLEGGSL